MSFLKDNFLTINENARLFEMELDTISSRDSPVKAIEAAYYAFNQINKVLKKEGRITCSKGCHFCCHDNILVGEMEAEYLLEKVDFNKADKKIAKKQYAQDDFHSLKWEDQRCPFLQKDKSCGIYEHRPSICREHNSISPKENCKPNEKGDINQQKLYTIEASALLFATTGYLKKRTKDGLISLSELVTKKEKAITLKK